MIIWLPFHNDLDTPPLSGSIQIWVWQQFSAIGNMGLEFNEKILFVLALNSYFLIFLNNVDVNNWFQRFCTGTGCVKKKILAPQIRYT